MNSCLTYIYLFVHEVKMFYRNLIFQKIFIEKILIILITLNMYISIFIFAYIIPKVFNKLGIEKKYFLWIIIILLILDLILRLIVHRNISISLNYLGLNISRKTLIIFTVVKQSISYFNLNAFIFVIAYESFIIYPFYGINGLLFSFAFITFSVLFTTYFSTLAHLY